MTDALFWCETAAGEGAPSPFNASSSVGERRRRARDIDLVSGEEYVVVVDMSIMLPRSRCRCGAPAGDDESDSVPPLLLSVTLRRRLSTIVRRR